MGPRLKVAFEIEISRIIRIVLLRFNVMMPLHVGMLCCVMTVNIGLVKYSRPVDIYIYMLPVGTMLNY